MTTVLVVLLRGINVGGHNRLAMADLRRIAEAVGVSEPETYVQSGNLIGRSDASTDDLAEALSGAIAADTGLAVPVIVRTADEFLAVVASTPFPDVDDPTMLHVTFFREAVDDRLVELDADRFAPERIVVTGREAYLSLPNGMGRSKLAQAASRVDGLGTTRNWKTVLELDRRANGR